MRVGEVVDFVSDFASGKGVVFRIGFVDNDWSPDVFGRRGYSIDDFGGPVVIRAPAKEFMGFAIPVDVKGKLAEKLSLNPLIIAAVGERSERKKFIERVGRYGVKSGWLSQSFLKGLDNRIEGALFELLSIVYELRVYFNSEGGGRFFITHGTANFYPKGTSSMGEALSKIMCATPASRYYVFVKKVWFKLLGKKGLGAYGIDRVGSITVAPDSDIVTAKKLLEMVYNRVVTNFANYSIGYTITTIQSRNVTLYMLEDSKEVFLPAVNPGRPFFEEAMSILGRPGTWNRTLLVLPLEVTNPRIVSRIIDRKAGSTVIVIASFDGIRVIPAPGFRMVYAETIGRLISMLGGIVSDSVEAENI